MAKSRALIVMENQIEQERHMLPNCENVVKNAIIRRDACLDRIRLLQALIEASVEEPKPNA